MNGKLTIVCLCVESILNVCLDSCYVVCIAQSELSSAVPDNISAFCVSVDLLLIISRVPNISICIWYMSYHVFKIFMYHSNEKKNSREWCSAWKSSPSM